MKSPDGRRRQSSSDEVRASEPDARPPRSKPKRARKKQWVVRTNVASPRASFEELEIRTSDGASLRALVDDPAPGVPLRGTLVLAHAMFARKTSFGRRDAPGLSSALTARGFRTIAFDFRGHGDSTTPHGEWGYDDLVRQDLPAVTEYARARGEDRPVIVVGHSLGGQVALAAQGTKRIAVDAIVALATNVWLRELERSRVRWGAKAAIARTALALAARANDLAPLLQWAPALAPSARRLGVGNDPSLHRHLRELFAGVMRGEWRSADGADDYKAALAHVHVPVAAVLGDRDRIACHPEAGKAFVERCAGAVAIFHAPASHMELVTSPRAHEGILAAAEWALRPQARP